MREARWLYSTLHSSPCKLLEEQTLWGETTCRIWLPAQNQVVNVPKSSLTSLPTQSDLPTEAARLSYIATAARIAEVVDGNLDSSDPLLLAPMESNVIPLPHQLHALARAVGDDRIRFLLADEVGLGKTIEAGLIMRELKLRGLVRRTLVVAPKGLATQWIAEMEHHFNEQFQLILGEDISSLHRLSAQAGERLSLWHAFDQVVVSLDSVKPLEKRRGWNAARVDAYNRDRFEDLITAQWDLVIVDEAHRLGGSTEQVARYKLGRGLAEAAPYLLLLSATPHQGKSDAFRRLLSLIDEEAFIDDESVSRKRVAPYVIRTEKRKAITASGEPLFKPRRTELAPVAWQDHHQQQRLLYEAVTDYAREGYNRALQEQKRHIGFLMILMQRLVVSSTRAIRTTLERRLKVLQDEREGVAGNGRPVRAASTQSQEELEDLYDLDGQALLEELVESEVNALETEAAEVETLLRLAASCEHAASDAKAEALLAWLYKLQAEESDSELKLLVFTEFVPTQEMLAEFLTARGISVATLNGSMTMEERKAAQEAFRASERVLISTDAGGEGLNLQFAHVVINYDIPWNPMRLEQRIGRVDRIGQEKVVRAINFVFEDSVEFRVREVLERKLAVIFEEFGIDKTGDVLDSAQAGELFEEMFTSAILDPDATDATVEETLARLRAEIEDARTVVGMHGMTAEPDSHTAARLRAHPLPHWIERMTLQYLEAHGGTAKRQSTGWELQWPDGSNQRRCVFRADDLAKVPGATLLTLEDNRIRGLVSELPLVVPGQPIPVVTLPSLPTSVEGLWGLFRITVSAENLPSGDAGALPLLRQAGVVAFVSEEGKLFLPTARRVWELLSTEDPIVKSYLEGEGAAEAFGQLFAAVHEVGEETYTLLKERHLEAVKREEERGEQAYLARQRAIERVGLEEVRAFRATRLAQEEKARKEGLQRLKTVLPAIQPLLLLYITQSEGT